MTETYFSADALAALDELWATPDLTLTDIKRRMEKQFSMKFDTVQLRDAARRNDVPVEKKVGPPMVLDALPAPGVRPVDKVGLVAPGTFPVPARGFSMLRAK